MLMGPTLNKNLGQGSGELPGWPFGSVLSHIGTETIKCYLCSPLAECSWKLALGFSWALLFAPVPFADFNLCPFTG